MEKHEIVKKIQELQMVYQACPSINAFLTDYLDCLQNGTRGYKLTDTYKDFRSIYQSNSIKSPEDAVITTQNQESMEINFCRGFNDNRFIIYFRENGIESKMLCYMITNGDFGMEQISTYFDTIKKDVVRSTYRQTQFSKDGLIKSQEYKEHSTNKNPEYSCKIFGESMFFSDPIQGTYLYEGEIVGFCKEGHYDIESIKYNNASEKLVGKKLSEQFLGLEQIQQLAEQLGYVNNVKKQVI